MKVTLLRDYYADHTRGSLLVQDDLGNLVFTCQALELPWRDNAFQVSCIPEGEYDVERRTSAKFKQHFHVKGVPKRTFILLHPGNFTTDILGCILPGKRLTHLNADAVPDIEQTRITLNRLLALLGQSFRLSIRSFTPPPFPHSVAPDEYWKPQAGLIP